MRSTTTPIVVFLILLIAAPLVWAVRTSHWLHTTESDFKQGIAKHVVASNLGDLKLSRDVKTLLGQDPRISAVFALAQAPDGTVYAGTGPEGILLAIKNDKVATAAELGQRTMALSLLVDQSGRLLIGTGGEKGQILRIDRAGDKPKQIFTAPDVQYIWAMVETPDGLIYAATGPNGQLFQINPDGSNKVLLDSDENNLMCLISDGKDFLYAGTDPNGLVIRVNRKTGEMFVVYDAPETEISALARDAHGNLYAGTAQAPDEAGAGEENKNPDEAGRPEGESREVPIPSKPPAAPAPPPIPGPAPGEPLPIPKQTRGPIYHLYRRPLFLSAMAPGDAPSDTPGDNPAGPPTSAPSAGVTAKAHRPTGPSPSPEPERPTTTGNAVYRIDPDGFVTEIFRQQNVSVFSIVEQDGSLLVATGDDGNLYQINPAAEETLVLAKVDSKDIVSLLPTKDGRIFMGMANSGDVAFMTPGYASQGTYTSPVLDAKQISKFGKIQLRGTLPAGTGLKVSTRSGNVEESSAPGWSDWSDDVSAAEFVQTTSPSARYLQYRLTFTSSDGKATPVVEEINAAYQVPNLPPQIKSIKIAGPKDKDKDDEENSNSSAGTNRRTGTGKVTITWMASDPNEDELVYSLFFRTSSRSPWILLKDKLKDPTYDWDTRNVGDGRYEIKVEASDAAANPVGQGKTASRVSDPIMVDNTPPIIGDIKSSVAGADVTIKLNVVDRTSTVARLEYSIDSSEQWQSVLPSDSIADSPQEAYDFVIRGLSSGPHQIALRASDSEGNRAFETANIVIEKK